jgi:hypothetical protein
VIYVTLRLNASFWQGVEIICYFLLLLSPQEMRPVSLVGATMGWGFERRRQGEQCLSPTHLQSVCLHLQRFVFSTVHRPSSPLPSVVISCGRKIFYFRPPCLHTASQVERISISLKLVRTSPSPPLLASQHADPIRTIHSARSGVLTDLTVNPDSM